MQLAQLMPLPLTVSCFSKIQIGFTFLVPAHPGSPGQRAVKRVCVSVSNHCRFQHDHPLRGAHSVRLQILLMGMRRQRGSWSVAVHNHKKVIGWDPYVQVSMTCVLTCGETVHQRLCMTREIRTWLSDSRVGSSSMVDHRSQSSLHCSSQ